MHILLLRVVAILVAFTVLAGPGTTARAADEAARARAVIGAQEQAFARDDAGEAFSYAAPGVVNLFHTPDVFMEVVRRSYAPVYRHRSFVFGAFRSENGGFVQDVHIRDANGDDWEARYTLETQPDGSLKITSCVLTKSVEA